jgi:amphi-Trp domain-containing protein
MCLSTSSRSDPESFWTSPFNPVSAMADELEYEFEYENEFGKNDVADLLETLARGIRKGRIDLALENTVLKLKVDDEMEVQFDAEICLGVTELNMVLRWGVENQVEAEPETIEEEAPEEEEDGSIEEDEDVRKKKQKASVVPKVPAEGEEIEEEGFDTHEL